MARVEELLNLGLKPVVPVPEVARFTASKTDLPFMPEPYSSIMDDAKADIRVHKYKNELRQIALHSIKLRAGQSNRPNGEFGRPATPDPVLWPEMTGGRVLATNI